jgi:DNA-binding SARP family transcriptional activator
MSHLQINLLGTFQVMLDGMPITRFESDKVRALLAYLVVEADRPHWRETLMNMFWPEASERAARHNLRQALYHLRHLLNDDAAAPRFVRATRQSIQFCPQSNYSLDVSAFNECVKRGMPREPFAPFAHTSAEALRCLERGIALYQGDFLLHSVLVNSLDFEQWMLTRREALRAQAMAVLEHLVDCHAQQHNYARACSYARRLTDLDPLREESQRILIDMLARSGQRNAALIQYRGYVRLLAAELEIEPELATVQLYESLKRPHC